MGVDLTSDLFPVQHADHEELLPEYDSRPVSYTHLDVYKRQIDYFAVSLPDLLIFEENLNERNRKHCLFMVSLGLKGLGRICLLYTSILSAGQPGGHSFRTHRRIRRYPGRSEALYSLR